MPGIQSLRMLWCHGSGIGRRIWSLWAGGMTQQKRTKSGSVKSFLQGEKKWVKRKQDNVSWMGKEMEVSQLLSQLTPVTSGGEPCLPKVFLSYRHTPSFPSSHSHRLTSCSRERVVVPLVTKTYPPRSEALIQLGQPHEPHAISSDPVAAVKLGDCQYHPSTSPNFLIGLSRRQTELPMSMKAAFGLLSCPSRSRLCEEGCTATAHLCLDNWRTFPVLSVQLLH